MGMPSPWSPDSGPEIAVTVQPNARLLRIAPGEKDLKNATPVQLQDLQVGDRIRVRGQASADAKSIAALEIIVIAHSDLEARHEQERQDWQKRGLGGLVSAVDPVYRHRNHFGDQFGREEGHCGARLEEHCVPPLCSGFSEVR